MAGQSKKKKKPNKNRLHGHYCYVCGQNKSNESFSGRGHANHICKKCHALPAAERNGMIAVRKAENMAFRWLSESEIKWLWKRMNDQRPEVREAARMSYRMKFPQHDINPDKLTELKTPVLFSELDDERKKETLERLGELIDDFFEFKDYLPDDEDRDEILTLLCYEISESLNELESEPYDLDADRDLRFDFGSEFSFDERIALINEILEADAEDFDLYIKHEEPESAPQKELVVDNELTAAYDGIVAEIIADMKANGFELQTFADSLLVAETERLKIRRLYEKDLGPLFAIMKKPAVMYAWDGGFKKSETRKWIHRQYDRYAKDGFGYFAAVLKSSGKLIGQAGLMTLEMNGESAVEIGYIFDDGVWGRGYAYEAARACVELAFNRLGLDRLYAAIRPENAASVKLAEKLGMRKTGELVKTYQGKEIPHDVYLLEKI